MKIGIIGGGSIGLLLSSYLAEKHEVTIYVRREEQKLTINKHGLVLSGSMICSNVKALMIDEMKKEDCLFICVKQINVPDVLTLINEVNVYTPLIFLQNGMGHVELVRTLHQPVYVGVVEHGAKRISDNEVIHTGKGIIKIAVFNGCKDQLKHFLNELSIQDFPVIYDTNWESLLAKKLVINTVINPLTALFNVKNGDIVTNRYIFNLARELCLEASTILGLDFSEQWEKVQAVANNTAENTSSMLNDIKRKIKTENEAISGYLIHKSKTQIPYTWFVYMGIKALEEKKEIHNDKQIT